LPGYLVYGGEPFFDFMFFLMPLGGGVELRGLKGENARSFFVTSKSNTGHLQIPERHDPSLYDLSCVAAFLPLLIQ
jgi:hypothetical protein